jgi:hypothetical protein
VEECISNVGYMGRCHPILRQVPQFQLKDELALDGEGDVMCGRTYTRRHRARDVRRAQERADEHAGTSSG